MTKQKFIEWIGDSIAACEIAQYGSYALGYVDAMKHCSAQARLLPDEPDDAAVPYVRRLELEAVDQRVLIADLQRENDRLKKSLEVSMDSGWQLKNTLSALHIEHLDLQRENLRLRGQLALIRSAVALPKERAVNIPEGAMFAEALPIGPADPRY